MYSKYNEMYENMYLDVWRYILELHKDTKHEVTDYLELKNSLIYD